MFPPQAVKADPKMANVVNFANAFIIIAVLNDSTIPLLLQNPKVLVGYDAEVV